MHTGEQMIEQMRALDTGVPKALLGHRVVKEHHRPALPVVMPGDFKDLVKECWHSKPDRRCVRDSLAPFM